MRGHHAAVGAGDAGGEERNAGQFLDAKEVGGAARPLAAPSGVLDADVQTGWGCAGRGKAGDKAGLGGDVNARGSPRARTRRMRRGGGCHSDRPDGGGKKGRGRPCPGGRHAATAPPSRSLAAGAARVLARGAATAAVVAAAAAAVPSLDDGGAPPDPAQQ